MAHGGRERCMRDFGGETPKERELLEGIDMDGRITLKFIFK